MHRVGVDLMDVPRITRSIERYGDRFFARFFTPAERVICRDRPERLAARYAAKEAVAKALGTGIGDVGWKEIEVLNDERGRPILVLHGKAAALSAELGLSAWEISLSHTAEYAVAFVVAT